MESASAPAGLFEESTSMAASAVQGIPRARHRMAALDWLRGIVMVIMASDHAADAFDAGRLATDSVLLYNPAVSLDNFQFIYRWWSHLCAPTFLFLAGTSLALSIERRQRRGDTAAAIDRDLLIRGLIIISVDLLLINWFWLPGMLMLQVMYAIGFSFLLMIPLRRLPVAPMLAIAVAVWGLSEMLLGESFIVANEAGSIISTLLFGVGVIDTPVESFAWAQQIGLLDKIVVVYPVLPWWGMMALGWGFGHYLMRVRREKNWRPKVQRLLWQAGLLASVVFVALRGLNAIGNMQLLRLDGSWSQWLHVSKYPPSLTFIALELAVMAFFLWGLFKLQGMWISGPMDPILLFGQTPFFFYIVHIVLIEAASYLLGMHQTAGIVEASVATLAALVLVYPLCFWFRDFKAQRGHTWLRFL